MQTVWRWICRCLAGFLLLPSLLVLIAGLVNVFRWGMTLLPDRYYVAHPYLQEAAPWLTVGAFGLLGSVVFLRNPHRSKHWLWFPLFATLYALYVPNAGHHHNIPHTGGMSLDWVRTYTAWDLESRSIELWYSGLERGRFECPGGDESRRSRFGVNGQTLSYDMRCVSPELMTALPEPERPGVIVMAVSADGQEAWFRVSTLGWKSDHPVVWLPDKEMDQPLVLHQTLKGEPVSPFARQRFGLVH